MDEVRRVAIVGDNAHTRASIIAARVDKGRQALIAGCATEDDAGAIAAQGLRAKRLSLGDLLHLADRYARRWA